MRKALQIGHSGSFALRLISVAILILCQILPHIGTAHAASGQVQFGGRVLKVENGIGFGPENAVTKTFIEQGAVSVSVSNPGNQPRAIKLQAFDARLNPVLDVDLQTTVRLRAGETRTILATIPLDGAAERRVQICASSGDARQCGRYIIRRH